MHLEKQTPGPMGEHRGPGLSQFPLKRKINMRSVQRHHPEIHNDLPPFAWADDQQQRRGLMRGYRLDKWNIVTPIWGVRYGR